MENESYNAYASTLMRLDHDGEAQKESMACPAFYTEIIHVPLENDL